MKPGPKKLTAKKLEIRGSSLTKKRLAEEKAAASKSKVSSNKTVQKLKMPDDLDKVGRATFRRLEKVVRDRGILRRDCREPLATIARAFSDYQRADAECQALTATTHLINGVLCKRPEISIRSESWNRYVTALAQLGLFDLDRAEDHGPEPVAEPSTDDGEAIGSDGLPMSKSTDRFFGPTKFQSQPGNTALIVDSAGGIIETVVGPDLRPIR